ncbi:MAG TPA: class F sortase [Dehalococcoidia bacterium]|nr:class F sortase [Dehalococcoidia bacterium]
MAFAGFLFILSLAAAAAFSRPAGIASAQPMGAVLDLPLVDCRGFGVMEASFGWLPAPGTQRQWLELSVFDNGFAPGTFVSTELPADAASHRAPVLRPDLPNFWRIRSETAEGPTISATGAFMPCYGPILLQGPLYCHFGSIATVEFRWAPLAVPTGQQWLEISPDPAFPEGALTRIGPLSPATQTFRRGGFGNGETVFFRVVWVDTDGNERVSQVGGFTPDCLSSVSSAIYPSDDTLAIPRLGIRAPVNVRDVGGDGVLGVPEGAYDVVRYNFGQYPELASYPGQGGTTLIGGHLDYYVVGPAVFWPLRRAEVGDVVEYRLGDGTVLTYVVDWVADIPWDESLNPYIVQGGDSLILITCTGTFDRSVRRYDLRRLVHATRQ